MKGKIIAEEEGEDDSHDTWKNDFLGRAANEKLKQNIPVKEFSEDQIPTQDIQIKVLDLEKEPTGINTGDISGTGTATTPLLSSTDQQQNNQQKD